MPQDKSVAAFLGMLRHLQLMEDDVGPNLKTEVCNHPTYTSLVVKKLKPALNGLLSDVKAVRDKRKKCEDIDIKLCIESLEQCSKDMLKWILDNGEIYKGNSLDFAAEADESM